MAAAAEPEEKGRIDVAQDLVVGRDDLLQVDVDKVVERVNVLLDEAAHLEKRGQQAPFFLCIPVPPHPPWRRAVA